MGRKKINKVYRYFNLDESNKTAKCVVAGCEKVLKTLHGANLLKHLSKYHEKEYKEVLLLNKENYSSAEKSRLSTQDTLLQECTNLVTVHGRPLSLIDDHAFQNIISLIPNVNFAINSQNVRSTLKDTADQLRSNLANEVRNLPICLKVDVASLSNRSFMGVNAQYVKDGKIVLRNLAVIELFKRHTSEHLKEILIFILRRFRIHNNQIYCITTDNGANILKMSRLIAAEAIQIEDNYENNDPEEGDRFDSSCSLLENITNSDSESDGDNVDNDNETENYFNDQIMQLLNFQLNIVDDEDNVVIAVVRCAAHTLQLAMQDACNDNIIQSVITSARNIIKRLRTPTFSIILKEKRKKKPTLDCSTRWHSTIDMVESIINLKDICATSELLYLPDETWNDLDLFLKSMLPGKKLTKILQKEQLTMGDFYIEWMKCQFELQKINTPLARQVICHMKHRQAVLFDNNAFISAIYLDPRVNSTLTDEQQSIAQINLINLYIHIQKINLSRKNADVSSNVEMENMPSTSNDIQAASSSTDLEDFLNSSYIEKHVHNISTLVRRSDPTCEIINTLKASFKVFLEEPLLKSSESVLKFWEEKQVIYPQLYQLARVALSAPATQVSVERLFSALKFIVSNLRMNLKDDIIEDILFVRCYKLYR